MRIKKIDVFQTNYSMAAGKFVISGGKVATEQDSTIVRIETQDGLVGWGEHCVFSPSYMIAHAEGARAALKLLAPAIIGMDPTSPDLIYSVMDRTMKGHLYAKAAIDIACWDLLGKYAKLPLYQLLGGKHRELIPLYAPISLATPEKMKEDCLAWKSRGYKRFQMKVGTDFTTDVERVHQCLSVLDGAERIIFDANGNWSQHEAVQIVSALAGLKIHVEQPCGTIEECARVRQRSNHPYILDESISSYADLLRAHEQDALDVVMLKISRLGGITPVKRARELAMELGLAVTVEDSGGSDIITAAMAHLSASTPERFFMNGFFTGTMVKERISDWGCKNESGFGHLPNGHGLGIVVNQEVIGSPVASYS